MESLMSIDKLYSFTDRELVSAVRELESEVKRLNIENIIFERFLTVNDPPAVDRMVKTMEKIQEMYMKNTEAFKTASQMSDLRLGQIVQQKTLDNQSIAPSMMSQSIPRTFKGPRINLSQKTDLVMREMDELHTSLEKFIQRTHREKNRLIAEIEETGIRDGELKEAMNTFEQVVVTEGVEALTQKIPAEKFVRYMQEWLKFAQTMLEKLRLRTSSLRTQYHKLKHMLTQKEEAGECVHEVDFEKLHIENLNFHICMEQKNKHLIELKQINGKANLLLATHKKFLYKQQVMMNEIQERVGATMEEVVKLQRECDKTDELLEKYNAKYEKMNRSMSMYIVPDVMEYINKKAQLADVHRTLKVWMRKSNIQKIAMATYAKTMCQLTGLHKPKSSWFVSTISTPDSLSLEEKNIRRDTVSNYSRVFDPSPDSLLDE